MTRLLLRLALPALGLMCLPARGLSGQAAPPPHAAATWEPITTAGATRAAAAVESVFVARDLARTTVPGGDFAAYLLARLGMPVIPGDFHYTVSVDSQLIRIGGRIADLPAEARQALSRMVFLLPPQTRLEGQVELQPAGPQAVRFHLRGATVQGIPVPETMLRPMLADVGRQYPALTDTGRDLLVTVPPGARVGLLPGAIELTGP